MKSQFRKIFNFLENHIFLQQAVSACLITTILETLNRMSFWGTLRFALRSPMAFLCNVLIIFMSLSVSTLSGTRRRFIQVLISAVWLVFGIVNAIVLRYRMTPFSAEDFHMVPFLLKIADNYLTIGSFIAIIAAAFLLAAGLILLWMKLPRETVRRNWLLIAAKTGLLSAALYMALDMATQTEAISKDFTNLADAYDSYGFAYCFTNSIIDVGIDRPEDYSQERMEEIAASMQDAAAGNASDTAAGETAKTHPNIIMVQLESFFDPDYLKGFSYSQDPIPFFHELKRTCSSGVFHVPVVGAGTANTEFEILTGMSTTFFGAGEYPYNTLLKDTPVESIARILGSEGYHTAVLHNNTGTFYHRDQVFSQMGFDQFVPEEYMYDIENTPTNWAKDGILTDVTMDILKQSEEPDFIYSITVESHGRYPETPVLENPEIKVTGHSGSASPYAVEYYVNAVHEVDRMIEDLVHQLEELGEPAILVLYGDHLPALGFEEEEISQSSLYQTEYVIWDNIGLEKQDADIDTDKIGAEILEKCGLTAGIMPYFHEAFDDRADYTESLHLLEYDMLYGDGYIFEALGIEKKNDSSASDDQQNDSSPSPYQPSELRFGYLPVEVKECVLENDQLQVNGENFNPSSRIVIDDKVCDTVFVDRGTLVLDGDFPEDTVKICVGQYDENLVPVGELTDTVIFRGSPA